MVHTVSGKVNDYATECLIPGWVVERVHKGLIEPLLVNDFSRELTEL